VYVVRELWQTSKYVPTSAGSIMSHITDSTAHFDCTIIVHGNTTQRQQRVQPQLVNNYCYYHSVLTGFVVVQRLSIATATATNGSMPALMYNDSDDICYVRVHILLEVY
jgi:hypothetical protein